MVVEIDGVINEFDAEAKSPGPEATEYQSITFPAEVAEIETVPEPHREPFVPDETEGTEFTVAVTVVRVAEIQPVAAVLVSA